MIVVSNTNSICTAIVSAEMIVQAVMLYIS